jgi:hypothetical protein
MAVAAEGAHVLDEPPAQIARLQIAARVEAVHEPQLIPGAAGGDVVALLDGGAILQRQDLTGGCVDHRQKDDVAFIALELGRVARHEAAALELVERDQSLDELGDTPGLLVTEE